MPHCSSADVAGASIRAVALGIVVTALVQTTLLENVYGGDVFVFRGRRGDLIKVLWADRDGLCLFAKRMEDGEFRWPKIQDGVMRLTSAQLGALLEGLDWRRAVLMTEATKPVAT